MRRWAAAALVLAGCGAEPAAELPFEGLSKDALTQARWGYARHYMVTGLSSLEPLIVTACFEVQEDLLWLWSEAEDGSCGGAGAVEPLAAWRVLAHGPTEVCVEDEPSLEGAFFPEDCPPWWARPEARIDFTANLVAMTVPSPEVRASGPSGPGTVLALQLDAGHIELQEPYLVEFESAPGEPVAGEILQRLTRLDPSPAGP